MQANKHLLRSIVEVVGTVVLAEVVSTLLVPMVIPQLPTFAAHLMGMAVTLLIAAPLIVYRMMTVWSIKLSTAAPKLSTDAMRPVILILVGGVALTSGIAYWMVSEAYRQSEVAFDALSERVTTEVARRMKEFEDGLKSLRGLHEVSQELTLDEFRDYCKVVDPQLCFQGAMGQGYIQRVPKDDVSQFMSWAKENLGEDFQIKSAGNLDQYDDYFVICHIEPLADNQAAWGLDVGSETNRRVAAEKARATGVPTLTAKINLVQDQRSHHGFLYYLAVYQTGVPLDTRRQREDAFLGWVYMPITSESALDGILLSGDGKVDVMVYDTMAIDPNNKLFCDHGYHFESDHQKHSYQPIFSKSYPLTFGGRQWNVQISSNPNFDTSGIFLRPFMATAIGATLTILLATMVWNMGTSRLRAIQLAESMTVDLKAAKEEAEEGFRRFTTIYENVPVGVNVLDEDGRVQETNPAGLRIWEAQSEDEIRGASLLDQVPKQSHNQVIRSLCDAMAGRPCCVEFQMTGLRGTTRLIELHAVMFENPTLQYKQQYLLAALRDVTMQRKAEADLRDAREKADEANQSKSEFLANMSHEIRTPMTAILGYTDLLAEQVPSDQDQPERKEYINTIRRNGEHLLMIINDILDLSKIEAGKMTIESVPMRVDSLVRDVMDLMQVKAAAKGLALDSIVENKIPMIIDSDPVRVRQILVNLLGNAIKFTEIGRVRLRVCYVKSENCLRLSVEDTGIGMSEDQQQRLFQAFVQADNSTARRFGGTGLGLRISKRLAQMLGGDITVTSEPEVGSIFCLSLALKWVNENNWLTPDEACAAASPKKEEVESSRNPPAFALEGMRILLAEDGPDNIRLISFHLRKAGAEVVTVENGKLTVEQLTQDGTIDGPLEEPARFDLILTDMQMPEMDGYQATRLLREKGCTLPIVALTAHAMAGDLQKCLDAGCTSYTTKPIDRKRLIEVLQQYHPEAMESAVI
ncbi:Autoinducer 2 sensor kinase/phosphatase LuxQ [Bremerella volcania]|uniref:histidine kinase n=1 Tax=Bremerella volcania TaxID=2527984 RepID=A0A518C2L4_9BACT|nr:CHASE domain-containing protein [Bremerella volcania]QDU73470.1 Autoinducer 2 sensor kinase/phosphatase LuxQ [Bremerella volcania]